MISKVPQNLKLSIHDVRTGKRLQLDDSVFGVEYYMRLKASEILVVFRKSQSELAAP